MALETLGIRALVTFTMGPLILFCAWLGGWYFMGVVSIISILALHEFYGLATHKGATPATWLGLSSALVIDLMLFLGESATIPAFLVAMFMTLATIELFRNKKNPILNVATTLMGLFYIALPFGFLILIRQLPGTGGSRGGLIILIFLAVWICDSAAYLVGSRFGKHKLFPRVSPNKTIEGTLAGFVFAIITAYVAHVTFLPDVNVFAVLAVGAICGSLGQASDLLESLFKRDAEVKDSSSLIPGHGGVLDRFDSEILVAPAVYLLFRLIAV